MPKRQQKNAFYWYMQDIKPRLRAEGIQFQGMDSVVPHAHPRWKVCHVTMIIKNFSVTICPAAGQIILYSFKYLQTKKHNFYFFHKFLFL